MADTGDTPAVDFSPQWTPPPVVNDALLAAMQGGQPQPNELDRQPAPALPPQQNELDALGTQPPPSASAPMPSAPTQPHEWKHLEGLHKALNAVADILGPAETAHVRQDPKTGDWTVTKEPSTTAEKWHRIAATALAGAATGLAHSQGPGGLARAGAAGFQTGMQAAPQQQEAAQQEADFNQKQLLARANRIYLAQQTGRLAAEARLNDQKFSADEEAILNRQADLLTSGRNVRDAGIYDPSDPDAARQLALKDPELRDAFLNKGDKRLRYVLEGDHKIHLVLTDKTEEEQRITEPTEVLSEGHDGDKPTLVSKMGGVGKTKGEIRDSNAAVQKQVLEHQKLYGEYLKNTQDKEEKLPTSAEQATARAEEARAKGDMAGYTKYSNMAKSMNQTKLAGERPPAGPTLYSVNNTTGEITPVKPQVGKPLPAGTTTAAGLNQPKPYQSEEIVGQKEWGGGDPNSPFEINSQKLADSDSLPDDYASRAAKGQPTRADYIARADQIDRARGGPGISTASMAQENRFAADPTTQAVVQGIDRIIGPTGQMSQLLATAQHAGLDNAAPINQGFLAGNKFLGDQGAKDFMTALGETRRSISGLMGNPLVARSGETNIKLQQADEMLGQNPTIGNLRSAAAILTQALKTQRQSIVDPNRYLRKRYGGTTPATPTGNTGNTQQGTAKSVPTGKVPAYNKQGQIVGYADDKKGTNYHAF